MFAKLVLWFLFTKCIEAQLNGEFWWLNSKVSEYHGKQITPPQYEDLTEFDTDDTRIIFNENSFHTMKHGIINNPKNDRLFIRRPDRFQTKKKKMVSAQDKIVFTQTKMEDHDKVVWPSDGEYNKNNFNNIASTNRFINNEQTTKKSIVTSTSQASTFAFAIKFPDRDYFYLPETGSKIISTTPDPDTGTSQTPVDKSTDTIKNITDTVFFGETDKVTERATQTKSICTYIKKQDCIKHSGFIYTVEFGKSLNVGPKDPAFVCCVLSTPIKKDNEKTTENYSDSKLYFPDKITTHDRYKRSDDELRQRNVLLQRKRTQEHRTKSAPTSPKIVTAEEDEDPYWNIKSSNFHPSKKPPKTTDYDYKADYVQEYEDELPRPGLLGIYSNIGRQPISWTVAKREQSYGEDADYDDVDDSDTSFGYGTIDPRQGNKKTKRRRQPIKLTSTPEKKYNPENQIINFQSNPNFEVLQGFKLLNLVRNKNMSKKIKEQSDVSDASNDEESDVPATVTSSESDNSEENLQLFSNCGRSPMPTKLKLKDAQVGEAEQGSHTWLIVVTPATDQDDILCYGTLIHPRAAITAADCVYETSTDDIIVIAGLWRLNEKTTIRKRTPAVHLHPKYRPGSIANNLAILSWTRPFKLCDEIQTACLAEPRQGQDCMMYGWGGFDQALRQRSRWQRARIHECNQAPSVKKARLQNAFCATVQSRGTVSGVGGPMICNVNGRDAVVGIAVSRDSDVVFLPTKEWAMKAEEFVSED